MLSVFYVTVDGAGRVQSTIDIPLPYGAMDCSALDDKTKQQILAREVVFDGAAWVPVVETPFDAIAMLKTLSANEVSAALDVLRATGKLSAATDEQLAAAAVIITGEKPVDTPP